MPAKPENRGKYLMKAVFLDIDGVLNDSQTYPRERTPSGYIGVDDIYIGNLKYLIDKTGADIILSSDWRSEWHHNGKHSPDLVYLTQKLDAFGLEIKDKTPGNVKGKGHTGRGAEIAEYLRAHPEIDEYVILDDNDFFDFSDPPCKGHVVITVTEDPYGGYDYELGFTIEKAIKAVEILNGKPL